MDRIDSYFLSSSLDSTCMYLGVMEIPSSIPNYMQYAWLSQYLCLSRFVLTSIRITLYKILVRQMANTFRVVKVKCIVVSLRL